MRHGGICAAVLLILTSPGQRASAASPSDPFTIDHTGAETREAEASLPVTFRIEPLDVGVACPRWRVMTLVKALPHPTWRLVRSTKTDGDREVILYGIPGRTTLVVAECPGRPGYTLYGPRVWGRRGRHRNHSLPPTSHGAGHARDAVRPDCPDGPAPRVRRRPMA